ncbi:(d)CMP kinase [Lachnospiraceae bacterium HCP1S3_A8]|nr:(d)CMP kinase [Lachnospiraceae bacterium]
MSSTYNIAIDGPAGAGKSTIAKLVAAKLGFIYVDTGAMYRAMAFYFLENGIQPEDETRVSAICGQIDISLRYQDGVQQVILNGRDVSGKIRTEAVGNAASVVSAYRAVRQALLALQQNLAKTSNVIMDGRDIGTCVLPHAQTKIYLTASSHVRAIRRYKELTEKGQMCNLEEIEQDIIDRDYRDMHREIAPLTQAADAVLLDSSEMTIDQVVDGIIGAARERGLA